MADTIPPGYAEVIIPHRHSALSRDALVTFGIQLSDTPTVVDANLIQGAYMAEVGASIDSNVTIGPTTLRVGQDGGEALVVVGNATNAGGTDYSDALNAGQSVLYHKRTSRGGRRGRGRFYIPWIISDANVTETGRIGGDQIAGYNDIGTDFLIALEALVKVDAMVVLHSPSGPEVENPTAEGLPNVVTSLQVDPIVGTQRRRLGR